MVTPIVMPKFGQMTEDSAIVEWLKKEGDTVAKGDVLFLVETDKSVMEVESFNEGTLLKIVVGVGVSVPVQSVVAYLGEKGEAVPATPAPQRAVAASAPSAVEDRRAVRTRRSAGRSCACACSPRSRRRLLPRRRVSASARARRRSPRTCVIDPHAIVGSGPEGRIVEKDVKAYLAAHDYASLRVSAAAKALAAKEGLDLIALGADNGGKRIEVADVERAIAEKPTPMSKMRQIIAQRLTQSVVTAPHFYVTVEVDMTETLAHRARLNAAGARYTVTDFIAQAAVLALKEFPAVNSATDGRTVRWHSRVHLGIAVNLDQGLVVPVVRDADEMTMAELSARAKAAHRQGARRRSRAGRDERIDLLDLEHGHARRGGLHGDHQSGRIGDPGGVQHRQEAGRARRRDRRAADHEDDAVVRSSLDRRGDGGPLHQQHQDQARG